MDRMREIAAAFLAAVVRCIGRLLSLLSDASVARLLRAVRPMVTSPDSREGLDDIIDAFRSGPPYSTLIRRMIAESDREELRDFLAGALFFKPVDIEKP